MDTVSSQPPDHVTQFLKNGSKVRSHGHIMFTAKICLNSVPGGPINFILGGLNISTTLQRAVQ